MGLFGDREKRRGSGMGSPLIMALIIAAAGFVMSLIPKEQNPATGSKQALSMPNPIPPIQLEFQTKEGEKLQAVFLPEKGMNLISFKRGDLEVIDQSTRDLFEERYAGLGALIGPHFHHRKTEDILPIKDESIFPHIARVKAKGVQDPFSHGIARYAPWKAEATATSVNARLTGKDLWNGVTLAELEGQDFTMTFEAHLGEQGLSLHLSIVSERDSLVGIHYYYALPGSRGKVISTVQDQVRINRELKPIPSDWNLDSQHRLVFDLKNDADYTFRPYPTVLGGKILLETERYDLQTVYECPNDENCWQLYHPKDASFVCIEPISAKDPLHPLQKTSSLKINLEIIPKSK